MPWFPDNWIIIIINFHWFH